ncbi:MAG: helix-turn-helix transcriptional regulator [Erysipelotrichaceae bacterium]|nr:helix-turn-helix transcriptional regulator [Erysipelotrichaceae bacterium]
MDKDLLQYPFLGELIRFYRKQRHITQTELVSLCDRTFSLKTLQRIENGKDIRNHSIYAAVAEKLGRVFAQNEDDYVDLIVIQSRLIRLFRRDASISAFMALNRDLDRLIEKHKKAIYLNELLRVFKEIVFFHLNGRFYDTSYLPVLEECCSALQGDTYNLVILYLFKASRFDLTQKPLEHYCQKTSFLAGTSLFCFDEIYRDMTILSSYEILVKYGQLADEPAYTDSFSRRFRVLDGLAYAEFDTGNLSGAYKYLLLMIHDDGIQKKVPEHYRLQLVKRAGIIAYSMKYFEQCIDHLLHVYMKDPSLLELNYLFLFDALEKTGNKEQVKKIASHLSTIKHSYIQTKSVIRYYEEKYSEQPDLKKLEDILCEQLSEKQVISSIYHPILREQLADLIRETHDYKKMFDFIDSQ